MKLNGIFGKGTGKLGSTVYAVSGGEQIVREYNPNVTNPNTDAQVAQRAKLKLMSQLAAALAPGIAFKKQGLVSARNQFIAANIGKCEFDGDKAAIPLANIDLTGGHASFPPLLVERSGSDPFTIQTDEAVAENVDLVVYVVAKQNDDNQLDVVDVKMVSVPGADRTFPATSVADEGKFVFYGYGFYNASVAARISYDNYIAQITADQAELSVLKSLLVSGGTATKTVAHEV